MITCWYLWWSRRQIKNKEPVPTPDMTIINIHGILANSVKVKVLVMLFVEMVGRKYTH
jgi:hypothetical protein